MWEMIEIVGGYAGSHHQRNALLRNGWEPFAVSPYTPPKKHWWQRSYLPLEACSMGELNQTIWFRRFRPIPFPDNPYFPYASSEAPG